jgi:salicylate hydroxylase
VWDEGESRPHVRLRDGRIIAVDLVLVADGIRSRLRAKVLHDLTNKASIDPIISDSVFYGVNVPLDAMETNPDAKPLMQQFEPTVWVDKHRYVVGRRTKSFDTWGGLFGVHTPETDSERMWDEVSKLDMSYGLNDEVFNRIL